LITPERCPNAIQLGSPETQTQIVLVLAREVSIAEAAQEVEHSFAQGRPIHPRLPDRTRDGEDSSIDPGAAVGGRGSLS
jgi:hypothetical protein